METFTLSFGRCWIIRAFGRSPLVRVSDRVEALLLALVFATALVLAPVAAAIGTAAYESRAQLYAEQARNRHLVPATVIEDSTITIKPNDAVAMAPVRWRVDGIERTGTTEVEPVSKVGDRLDIWVDGSGRQVAAPTPTSQAGFDAAFVGAVWWLCLMAGVAGLWACVRAALTRRRHVGWDRELTALVDDGGGRTGSQT